MTKGRSAKVKLSRKVLYELDGGDREKKKTFRVDVQPSAVTVCVPTSRRRNRSAPGSGRTFRLRLLSRESRPDCELDRRARGLELHAIAARP